MGTMMLAARASALAGLETYAATTAFFKAMGLAPAITATVVELAIVSALLLVGVSATITADVALQQHAFVTLVP